MEKYGTFFTKKEIHFHKQNNVRNNRKIKVLKNFYYVYAISYIPYYLAWPIVILLLSEYNDYRATIIGLTAIFNGVNTIILSVFIDPKLARLGQYNNIILNVYSNLLKLRIYASLFSFFALFLVVLLFDWK